MQKALLILASAVIITGFVLFLYFFGGATHTFTIHFDLRGEQLVFPEPPQQVYKAMVCIEGTLDCPTSFQMTMNAEPYNEPVELPAGDTDKVLYNGDWYAGSDLGLDIQPVGEPCSESELEVKLVYYE